MPAEKELGRGARAGKLSRRCGTDGLSTGASNDPNEESRLDSLSLCSRGALSTCAAGSLKSCAGVSEVGCASKSRPNDALSAPAGFSLNLAKDSPGSTIEMCPSGPVCSTDESSAG